jgi:phosphoribosyl 1,2-cyclic phosphodiesterase
MRAMALICSLKKHIILIRKVRFHLDYVTLREKLPLISAKRLILTHMSPDMLARVDELTDCQAAHDGLELEIL